MSVSINRLDTYVENSLSLTQTHFATNLTFRLYDSFNLFINTLLIEDFAVSEKHNAKQCLEKVF